MHFIGVATSLTIYVCCTSTLPTRSNLEFIYSHITRGHLLWIEHVQWTTNKSIKIFFVLIFYWHVWAYRATKCRSLYRVCIWINNFLDNEKAATMQRSRKRSGLLLACISIPAAGKMIFRRVVMILKCFLYTRITLPHCILYDIGAECRCMIWNTVSLRW